MSQAVAVDDGVFLGGETVTRGVVRSSRAGAGDVLVLAGFVAAALVVLLVGESSVRDAAIALGIVATGLAVCLPWTSVRDLTGGTSVRGWLGARMGFWWRRTKGLTAFRPGDGVLVPAGVGPLTTTDELVDGTVVAVTEATRSVDGGGTGSGSVVTVLEVQGDPGWAGLLGARWSAFLEYLGSEASLVSHVSTVASVTDWDATDHVWLTGRDIERVGQVDPLLVESYGEIVDRVREIAAARRTWVVLRFPVGRALRESGGGNVRAAAAEQTMAAVERARVLGLRMRPLDAVGQSALCRHLMDPEVSADDVRGLGEGVDCWEGAFPSFRTSEDRRSLVVDGVDGERYMSVWEVPGWTVEPAWLPRDFMYPLVTALSGKVNRSIVVTCELIASGTARASARADVTSDSAAVGRQATISDGTNEAQAVASRARLEDLAPGRPTVGVNWSMAVSFHSRSAEEHVSFERRMLGALADSYIGSPVRLRWRQDAALGLVMPLARAWRGPLVDRAKHWVGMS